MQYDELIDKVQSMAHIDSRGETEKAIQATLETLAERIIEDEAQNLAAQLPEEVSQYLQKHEGETEESFSVQEFYWRVSKKEHIEPPTAAHHAQAVMMIIDEAVTHGEIEELKAQLSEDYDELFSAYPH